MAPRGSDSAHCRAERGKTTGRAESASRRRRRTDTDRGPDQYRRPAVTCRSFATDLGLRVSVAAADAASAATADAAAGRALTTTAMMGTRTILEEAVERSAAANVVAYGGERQWTRDATDDENRALRGDVIDFLSRRLTPGAANTSARPAARLRGARSLRSRLKANETPPTVPCAISVTFRRQ